MIRMAWALVAALMMAGAEAAPPMTPADAAAAGKSQGQTRNPTTSSGINTTTGTSIVPGYATTSPEAAYFGGGNGNVATPTTSKLASCVGSTTAECVAINLMRHKSSTANPITIHPTDPMVVDARATTAAPAGALGVTNDLFVDPATGDTCAPGSTTTGTGSVTETCEARMAITDSTCERPWEFEIKPWWTYTCEKSSITVTRAVCERNLQVTVDWVPNCTLGENVVEQGFGWDQYWEDHTFHSDTFEMFLNGGVVRAKCVPTETTIVRMTLWGGDVNKNTYGGGSPNPNPDPTLLPTGDAMDVPVTVTSAITAPTSLITILPGSGCTAGNCRYNMMRGPKTYACPSGPLWWSVSDYSGTSTYIQGSYAETYMGDFSSSGAVCVGVIGDPLLDAEGNSSCPVGIYYSGKCYSPNGDTATIVGGAPGARSFSVSFVQPAFVPQASDLWVSTCGGLEASPTCSIVGESCTDGPSTKSINGADITRACWTQKVEYECRTAGGPNGCQPLTDEPLCAQISVDECVATAADGTCATFKAGYKCTKDMGPPPAVTETGHGYDTIKNALNESACTPYKTNPDCVLRDSTCTDTGSKTFFGFTFTKDCWNFKDTYTCPATEATGDCADLIARGCTVVAGSEACVSTLASGACGVKTFTYECGSPTSTTPTGAVCDATPYCINGVCYERERPSDPDFGTSVAQMEAARQIANYMDEGSMQIFMGADNRCVRKLLVNCCKGNGAGGTVNNTNAAFFTAVDFGRKFAGSAYVYDVLFASDLPDFIVLGMESLGITSAAGASTFTAYGVTLGWGSSGLTIVAFDPWSFAISVALQIVVAELMSCEDSDKSTAVKKDQGICERMGSYCSSRFLGACIETTESYCCFNSKLAKAINIQGKRQLGISIGDARSPNCRGLTVEEIGLIDMSLIDFSEFLADIVGNAIPAADATTISSDSIGARSPCTDGTGTVDPQQAGRMECAPAPALNGSATEGPATSPPPAPPPTGDLPPEVTAIFTPAEAVIGGTIVRSTNTINATSLTYTCTGAQAGTGTIPVGSNTTSFTALAAAEGKTTCQFLALNGTQRTTVEAVYEITKPKPTITATVVPNPVPAGGGFTATINTTNATSGSYTCSGVMGNSGTFAVGSAVVAFTAPATAGIASCVFKAEGNGFAATTTVSITVTGVNPVLTATATPDSVLVGETITLATSTTDAVSLEYTCSGSLVTAGLISASGTRALTATSTPIVTTATSVGNTTCMFKATSSSGAVANKTVTMTVTTPAASLSVAFVPSSVKVGQPYDLNTAAIGMSSLTWSCIGPKIGSGTLPVGTNTINYTAVGSEVGTTVCTFVAKHAVTGESTTATASITVREDIPVLTAEWGSSLVRVGDTAYLNTTTTDAVSLTYSCAAPMASSGSLPVSSSSKPFAIAAGNVGIVTCTVTATGAGGAVASKSLELDVRPKLPTVSASFIPGTVNVGESYTLSTDTTNASTLTYVCTGPTGSSGSAAVGPQSTTVTATLAEVGTRSCVYTAANAVGETATATTSITVKVVVPTITATWSPPTVDADQNTSLVTSTTAATSLTYVCTGSIVSSGSLAVGDLTTPFVLSASNVGTATCTLTATSSTGTTATATAVLVVKKVIPTVTAAWAPNSVAVGGSSNLVVTSTRATAVSYSCTGAQSPSGSLSVGSSSTTFSLGAPWVGVTTCTVTATSMTGDTATASAALTVTGLAPTVTATATPATARDGETVTLSATSTNATSMSYVCTGAAPSSGSLATPSGSVGLVMGPSHVGGTSCTVTASGPGGTATSTVGFTVKPKLPTVTASFSPASVTVGATYDLTTNTTNATSLSYVCTAPLAASATRMTGSQTNTLTATLAGVGTTTCTYTASNSIGETANASASITIVNPAIIPTVTAAFTASPVRWGSATTFQTTSTNATSVTYACTGKMTRSGSLAVPSANTAMTPTQAEVGVSTCTATATSSTGHTATASASVTVWPKVPTLSVTASPAPPSGAMVDLDHWIVTYNYTEAATLTTTCTAPVSSAAAVSLSPSTPNGTYEDWPWPNVLNNTTGTATCTSTVTNSIGETAIFIFYLRQFANGCMLC
jgi:conjugal transfer mating pair stabilization protein TraN